MLDHKVVHQSEMRLGKQTVAITELGTQCRATATSIPKELLNFVVVALSTASSLANAVTTSSDLALDSEATSKQVESTTPSSAITPAPSPTVATDATSTTQPEPSRSRNSSSDQLDEKVVDDAVRCENDLPAISSRDAIDVSAQRTMLDDWQWTLRLVRHGYRLGECALIRGRTPDAILADLIFALENREKFAIDQLFDRRTTLAIEELQRSETIPQVPPAVLQSFSSLWSLVQKWVEFQRNSPG
jgi:hypothetical protein